MPRLLLLVFLAATMWCAESRRLFSGEPQGNLTSHSRVKRAVGETISAATIGAIFSLTGPRAPGRTGKNGDKGGCTWQGTAPFCAPNGCPDQHGYTEEGRASRGDNTRSAGHDIGAGAVTGATAAILTTFLGPFGPAISAGIGGLGGGGVAIGGLASDDAKGNRDFGSKCITGSKRLCCRSKVGDEVWDGSWEDAQNNDLVRCKVFKTGDTDCGARLECESGKIKDTRGRSWTWKFDIVKRRNRCTGLRTVNSGKSGLNNCIGAATYGKISFYETDQPSGSVSESKACKQFLGGITWYKVE